MMIPNIGPTTASRGSRSTASRADALSTVSDHYNDVVDISQAARDLLAGEVAISRPAAMLSKEQVQVKMGLLRTFMEALFGQKESEKSTPEEEIATAVLEKPAIQAAIQTMHKNGWSV
ncbi:MAG: hypothetical protein H7836_07450 [Magnetococcus sp. YQC-3]